VLASGNVSLWGIPNPTPKPEHKNPIVKAEEIEQFLQKTGFVFEMRANEVLLDSEYTTTISSNFYDLEGETNRELDIIARKRINDIDLHLIIECKQSRTDKWIFLANKRLPIFWGSIKHLPKLPIEVLGEGFFRKLHFDAISPFCHNHLAYTIANEKETSHMPIDECISKLPKALVYNAAVHDEGRHLFLPVALFSGQMFVVSYNGKLQVDETSFLQYFTQLVSPAYSRQAEDVKATSKTRVFGSSIRSSTHQLGPDYRIHFVTEAGFSAYLKQVEEAVASVDITKWEPLPPSEIPF
jgi:hypothetical protein